MARYIVQHRRGSALQWADNNTIIPMEGEIVIEIDEENSLHKLKIGDGIHTYAELAYLMAGNEVVTQVLAKALPRVVTVSLDVDKWEEVTCETDPNLGYYGQQVNIGNITEHSRLDLQPDADMIAEFQNLNLAFVTENNRGVITVYSVGDMPLKSYTMQATIIETEFEVDCEKIVGATVGVPTTQNERLLAVEYQTITTEDDFKHKNLPDGDKTITMVSNDVWSDCNAYICTKDDLIARNAFNQKFPHNGITITRNDMVYHAQGTTGDESAYVYFCESYGVAQRAIDRGIAGKSVRMLSFCDVVHGADVIFSIRFLDENNQTTQIITPEGTARPTEGIYVGQRYKETTKTVVVPDNAAFVQASVSFQKNTTFDFDFQVYLLLDEETMITSATEVTTIETNTDVIVTAPHKSVIDIETPLKEYIDYTVENADGGMTSYLTPEDYGAVGDGYIDDGEAIRQCLDAAAETKRTVLMAKKYLVTSPIHITQGGLDIIANDILYTGNDTAVKISSSQNTIKIHSITSDGVGMTFRRDAGQGVKHNDVSVNSIVAKSHGIVFLNGIGGIYQNTIRFSFVQAGGRECYGICELDAEGDSWVTENNFYGGQIKNCKWAVYRISGNSKMYGVQIEEYIDGCFFIEKGGLSVFHPRIAEAQIDGSLPAYKFITSTNVSIYDSTGIYINKIDLSEGCDYYENANGQQFPLHEYRFGVINGRIIGRVYNDGNGSPIPTVYTNKAYLWGKYLIMTPHIAYRKVVTTEELDTRKIGTEEVHAEIKSLSQLPTSFVVNTTNTNIYLHESYCAFGYNEFDVEQANGFTCKIYDKLDHLIFDGTELGDGRYKLKVYKDCDKCWSTTGLLRRDFLGHYWEAIKYNNDDISQYVDDVAATKQDKFAEVDDSLSYITKLTPSNNKALQLDCSALYLQATGQMALKKLNIVNGADANKSAIVYLETGNAEHSAATKGYVDNEIKSLDDKINTLSSGGLTREIVESLPVAESASETTIYMVPASDASDNNVYEEYMFINSKWELIGSTAVDLTDINGALSDVNEQINSKQDKFAEVEYFDGYTELTAATELNINSTEQITMLSSSGLSLYAGENDETFIEGNTEHLEIKSNDKIELGQNNGERSSGVQFNNGAVSVTADGEISANTPDYIAVNAEGININTADYVNFTNTGEGVYLNSGGTLEGNADSAVKLYLTDDTAHISMEKIDEEQSMSIYSDGNMHICSDTNISIEGNEVCIYNLVDPIDDTDAANKKYVDSQVFANNVGRKTDGGGEIFNAYGDVAENAALAELSTAFNESTQAGAKAFKIIGCVDHSFKTTSYSGFRFKNSNDEWIFRNGETTTGTMTMDQASLSNKDLKVEIQVIPESGFGATVNMVMNGVADDGSITSVFSTQDNKILTFTKPSFIVMTSASNSSWLTVKNIQIIQGERQIEFDYNNYTKLREDTYSGFKLIVDDATGNIIGFTQNKDSRIQFNIDEMGVTCKEPFVITFDLHTINSNAGKNDYYSLYLTKHDPSTQGCYVVQNDGAIYNDILKTVPIHSVQKNRYSLYFDNNYECRGNILNVLYTDDNTTMSFLVDNFLTPDGLDAEVFYEEGGLIRAVEHPLCGTETIGRGAFSKGLNTRADHDYSSAEGRDTIAVGKYGHAEGRGSQAGWCGHAEGREALALGLVAHAQGYRTNATGYASSATGYTSTASGRYATTMGESTHAAGNSSFAGGRWTTAAGENSMAFGDHTYAKGNNQVVFGTHNIQSDAPIFIVGNGVLETARSNAFAVNKDGTATVGADPINDMDVATKQYVDSLFASLINAEEATF